MYLCVCLLVSDYVHQYWMYVYTDIAKCSRSIIFANYAIGAHSRILLCKLLMLAHLYTVYYSRT